MAWSLDTFAIFLVLVCVAAFHAVVFGLLAGVLGIAQADTDAVAKTVGLVVAVIVTWLYFALLESSDWQATFGKRALGMLVTHVNGDRISFWRASLRHFSKALSGAVFGTGFIMLVWTPQKQALHDGIAKTLVVRRLPPDAKGAVEQSDAVDEPRGSCR